MKTIRIEMRTNKTYAFIEVTNGDAKNAKEVTLTPKQREEIEKILNTEIEEHDIVTVTKKTDTRIEVGDKGTVVHIHKLGEAYEVEFADKNNIIITMCKNEIEKCL